MTNQDEDLLMNQIEQQIRLTRYPKQIDVVDRVMDQIETPVSAKSRKSLFTWAISAAASIIIGVSALFVISHHGDQTNDLLCDRIAEVYGYGYDNDYTSTNTYYTCYESFL